MDKMEKNIMVVKNNMLFKDYPRQTWFYTKEFNFEKIILENFEYMKRWLAEENLDYKQPIPYAILRSSDWKIFMYQRWWKTSQVWEKRLYDKVSFWIGWHVEEDVKNLQNPLIETLFREIEEEVWVSKNQILSTQVVGYINDDTNDVWKVHFGIVYIINLKDTNLALNKWELADWKFITINEAKQLLDNPNVDIENWSKIVLNSVF